MRLCTLQFKFEFETGSTGRGIILWFSLSNIMVACKHKCSSEKSTSSKLLLKTKHYQQQYLNLMNFFFFWNFLGPKSNIHCRWVKIIKSTRCSLLFFFISEWLKSNKIWGFWRLKILNSLWPFLGLSTYRSQNFRQEVNAWRGSYLVILDQESVK